MGGSSGVGVAVGAGVGVNSGTAVAVGSPALTAVGVGVGMAAADSDCLASSTTGCSRSHATHSSEATTIAKRLGTLIWNAPALTHLTISIRATPSSPHDFDCHTFIISASFAPIANTMPACCMMYQAYSHQMLAAESSFLLFAGIHSGYQEACREENVQALWR